VETHVPGAAVSVAQASSHGLATEGRAWLVRGSVQMSSLQQTELLEICRRGVVDRRGGVAMPEREGERRAFADRPACI
jgi:hypothetical protein